MRKLAILACLPLSFEANAQGGSLLSDSDILISIIFWPLVLGAAFWYARRKKHPERGAWSAFGLFVGIFGGIVLGSIGLLAFVWEYSGLEQKLAGAVGPILALVVAIPAWRYAVSKIRQPPKGT